MIHYRAVQLLFLGLAYLRFGSDNVLAQQCPYGLCADYCNTCYNKLAFECPDGDWGCSCHNGCGTKCLCIYT
jgi:hypothetical protein